MNTENKYGYTVGQIVKSKVALIMDDGKDTIVPAGTLLRLICFAPKVYKLKKEFLDDTHDSKEYFFNAVLASQENDYNRIRANFCTIEKIKKILA